MSLKQLYPILPSLCCTVRLKDGRTELREMKPVGVAAGDLTVTFRRGFAGDRLTVLYYLGLKRLMNDTEYGAIEIARLAQTYLERLSGSLTYQLIKDQTDIWFESAECQLGGVTIASVTQPTFAWQRMLAGVLRHEEVYVNMDDDSTPV